MSDVYAKMHQNRFSHIDDARRARDYQSRLSEVIPVVREHAQRYSRGSVTRVALDNLALELIERGIVKDDAEE